jgi:hypothetical protein
LSYASYNKCRQKYQTSPSICHMLNELLMFLNTLCLVWFGAYQDAQSQGCSPWPPLTTRMSSICTNTIYTRCFWNRTLHYAVHGSTHSLCSLVLPAASSVHVSGTLRTLGSAPSGPFGLPTLLVRAHHLGTARSPSDSLFLLISSFSWEQDFLTTPLQRLSLCCDTS